jgi:Na+/H+ antiporter NhaD/arsenite permease-like protein
MLLNQQQFVAIAIFAFVYLLIIARRKFNIPIWTSMLIGSMLMIGFRVISIESAFKSINLDVIAFLFGMFSIVTALDRSGVLKFVAIKMLSKARSPSSLLMVFVIGMGILSAFLVNDTIALLGIPLVVYISQRTGIKSTVLLIALSFGITVGSTMTPIGNPQNLLIAIQSGISLPFTTFLRILVIPTMINLFVTYFILKFYYRKELFVSVKSPNYRHYNKHNDYDQKNIMTFDDDNNKEEEARVITAIANPRLAKLSIVILLATIAGFIISEFIQFVFHITALSLSVIAILGATVLYAFSNDRIQILQSVDYSILVFFTAMFVFTAAIWSSGVISVFMSYLPLPSPNTNNVFQTNAVISTVSIALGQVLSNVPFVALYNHVMIDNGFTGSAHVNQWMMLAAASTISGNLTLLAAASNIIIIEAAERRGVKAFTFVEFFKIGAIVTAVNVAIYYLSIIII